VSFVVVVELELEVELEEEKEKLSSSITSISESSLASTSVTLEGSTYQKVVHFRGILLITAKVIGPLGGFLDGEDPEQTPTKLR